jgi:uncharacterized protein YlxP (DUF503 family)
MMFDEIGDCRSRRESRIILRSILRKILKYKTHLSENNNSENHYKHECGAEKISL